MEMDVDTGETAGSAVQIGNPIKEKQVQEVVLRARDEGLYTAITDCGAGGFSSAVGEMGAEVGARVQLANVALKYPGLRALGNLAQRGAGAHGAGRAAGQLAALEEICAGQDVEATVLGTFEPSGRLEVTYGGRVVGDLAMEFLHDGLPRRHLQADWRPAARIDEASRTRSAAATSGRGDDLLALLAHPDIRSKEDVVRRYDHEVQGGTAVKPLVGRGQPRPGRRGGAGPAAHTARGTPRCRAVALGNGICPAYGEIDPYPMAWAAVDEAMRNVVAVGADPDQVAILDNFCWGNPNLPDRLGSGALHPGLPRCRAGLRHALHLRQRQPQQRVHRRRRPKTRHPRHAAHLRSGPSCPTSTKR